jgi:DHA2 family multidrug resistance protein-like MFS transporter
VLTRHLGARVIMPAGLALMGLGLLDLSAAHVHTSYPPLAAAVAIMGAGMGLVMAPASTTIMATVPSRQAGAGSAINDTIREIGGALGIAVIGSLSAAAYSSRLGSVLRGAHVPGAVAHLATGSVAAADMMSSRAGGAAGAELAGAAHLAFVQAMSLGLRVAAAIALAAAVAAVFAVPGRSGSNARNVTPVP